MVMAASGVSGKCRASIILIGSDFRLIDILSEPGKGTSISVLIRHDLTRGINTRMDF